MFIGPDVGILDHIFGIGIVAEYRTGNPVQAAVITAHDQLETGCVAVKDAPYNIPVRCRAFRSIPITPRSHLSLLPCYCSHYVDASTRQKVPIFLVPAYKKRDRLPFQKADCPLFTSCVENDKESSS